jgi:glycosyltransferase involved in cell wall biosynthesis
MVFCEKNMNLISVIVPIYNVEAYLERCIDSIINQTYVNLEIILVDDGSSDLCGELCDAYAKQDNRIIVIHQENQGLSGARNSALDVMSGEYVTFVDSDDYISLTYIEVLQNALSESKADMSVGIFIYDRDSELISDIPKQDLSVMNTEAFIREMLYYKKQHTACGKLMRSILFSNIRFPLGKLYEDVFTIYKVSDKCERVAICDARYYYFMRRGSIQNQSFSLSQMDAVEAALYVRDFIKKVHPDLNIAAMNLVMSCCFHTLRQIVDKKKYSKERQYIIEIVKKYRWPVLKDPRARKKVKVACIVSYLGFGVLEPLYNRFTNFS